MEEDKKNVLLEIKETEIKILYLSWWTIWLIDAAHMAFGNGGHDKMFAETSKIFANIIKKMIFLFLSMCEVCQQKIMTKRNGVVPKPILHSEMNSRCQVDLIDFQTQPDGNFKL